MPPLELNTLKTLPSKILKEVDQPGTLDSDETLVKETESKWYHTNFTLHNLHKYAMYRLPILHCIYYINAQSTDYKFCTTSIT
jgi:hypothetical protein